ncbi:MAG: mRNA surveillance protein pelota, partial [Methanothrix sp.]
IMRQVGNSRGKVIVFSSEFEPWDRLASLGGVAALLRFKIA